MQKIEAPVLRFNPEKGLVHPLGVKPGGNIWLSSDVGEAIKKRKESLGMFSGVSEELFIDILSFCDSEDLLSTSAVSNHCRAFAFHPDLWRDLFWSTTGNKRNGILGNSWRDSVLGHDAACTTGLVQVKNVFSDLLFAPYRASGLEPTAVWIGRENIDRVSWKDLTESRFVEEYEKRNRPVIISDFIDSEWKSAKSNWASLSAFASRLGNPADVVLDCGSYSMSLSDFQNYLNSEMSKLDESPIFVFDTKKFSTNSVWQSDYTPIPLFGKDLFDLLDPPHRPDNKWILIGGPGASSKWHVDPNSTNAWNAVISGEKKWILVPPHSGPPPGVQVSSDGFAVRQPLTLTDWLDSGFYADLSRMRATNGMVEATCRAGEIMFVPRGWWHCVRNTDNAVTIAVTHNYAAESSLSHVRRFLKEKAHCVSGVPHHLRTTLWSAFDQALQNHRPDLLSTDPDLNSVERNTNEQNEEGSSFWDRFAFKTLSFHR